MASGGSGRGGCIAGKENSLGPSALGLRTRLE